ncbi:type VII secretion protein EccE [Streptoalloteichus tenebrarius]|uniref:type VII secretion protein EccE n=1 Tax=Streptoalloteichus tenebrarius (strain ATCC 17920 / DSM 40477 / JCM 4838 / CBS 697.72 / NBRC 16177 / NCIMB 11028 / NRRL B-12390 / A12253. 1 / ISP 5477) TaxID=1933 RepID=UPI0020A51E72|nr:type VII secretion protein EccE [Streptoalloteichus tenebrarius]
MSVGQVAVWEVAALSVLAFGFPFDALGVAVVAVAVLAVLATSVRFGGLCLYQWAVVHVRFLSRPSRSGQEAATPLLAVLPRLDLATQVDRAGNPVGVVSVDQGASHSAVVRVAPSSHPDPRTLVSLLHKAFERADVRLASAQLVVWAVPGPPDPRTHAVTPIRVHWLALRYRTGDDPSAALARGDGETGARKAVSAAALRLVNDLAEAGHAGSVLDTLELHQDLLVALGSNPDSAHGGHGRHRVEETWRHWSVGWLRHVCLVPKRGADLTSVLGWCAPGAVLTCTSYTVDRTSRGQVRRRAAIRVAIPRDRPWDGRTFAAAPPEVPLRPVTGRHGEHVVATLPLAL